MCVGLFQMLNFGAKTLKILVLNLTASSPFVQPKEKEARRYVCNDRSVFYKKKKQNSIHG